MSNPRHLILANPRVLAIVVDRAGLADLLVFNSLHCLTYPKSLTTVRGIPLQLSNYKAPVAGHGNGGNQTAKELRYGIH